jgi:radical SAM superfamily enzyme YgiQ (UPF0313 family)
MADGSLHVLLISANTEQRPDPVFPIGAAYIAAAAERAGHAVETFDCCFEDDPLAALTRQLAGRVPDVAGISLRNLDSSSYPQNTSYIDDYRRLVGVLRAAGVPHVVLGGSGFTIAPQALMAVLGADVGVVGEGELAFPWLLERFAAGAPPTSTADFRCTPAGVGVCVTPTARLTALDQCGTPLRERFDWRAYYARGGALNIQTKRGCAFECVFCSYPLLEGSKVRMRSAAAVVDEIATARAAHGVRHWFFVDNIFNLPPRHAKAICAELIARHLDVEWSAYLNPKFVDDELCALMAASGCKAIEFGTDSGAPAMIATLQKEFAVEDLRRASTLCHRHGLKFCHSLIFGGPGETPTTVEQTIALMDELAPTAVIAMTGIRVLPGTGMVDIARRDGQLDAADPLLEPTFYVSPGLEDALIDRIESHARLRPNWIVPGLGIKTNVAVLRKLRERNIKGQLWRLLR